MSPDRIVGVETGGCPHTAIREDASINLAAIDDLCEKFEGLELIIIESGGDNLAATFSPELSDLTLYVIDVAGGEKFLVKVGQVLPSQIYSLLIKLTLRQWLVQTLMSWTKMQNVCAVKSHFIFKYENTRWA